MKRRKIGPDREASAGATLSAGEASAPSPGVLIVVATPIGNLGDLSERTKAALAGADIVAAEDTRRTRTLLTHLGISRPMVSFRPQNQQGMTPRLLGLLANGKRVALVTDAGVPGIADPGPALVRAAASASFTVEAVPGPSAVTMILALAGFPADRFVFEGFLPQKKGRRTRLDELAAETRTVVIFESPYRVAALMAALAERCPEREAVVGRELTKLYEEIQRGTCAELAVRLAAGRTRGEYTLALAPLHR